MADEGAPPPASTASDADVSALSDYLLKLCPAILECEAGPLQSFLNDPATRAKLRSFAGDAQVQALSLHKLRGGDAAAAEADENEADENLPAQAPSFAADLEVVYHGAKTQSICILKRAATVEGAKGRSIASQLFIMNLADTSPLETLHLYLQNSFSPYFESFAGQTQKAKPDEKDPKLGIPAVKKRMAELLLSLVTCQQNVEIPEVQLAVDPEIKRVVAACKESGEKPRVDVLGERAQDAAFLNGLQAGVTRWTREIQRLTRLIEKREREASIGSAIQEINFWPALERALQAAIELVSTPEIELTLAVLKQARRYQVVAQFEKDTELRASVDKVTDYNLVVRDLPLNELLAAGDVEKMLAGAAAVFSHMRSLRKSKYPVGRALALVDAVWRDAQAQLVRLLQARRLMALPFEEFDAVAAGCERLFASWEAHFIKFRDEARDVAKRRNERLPARMPDPALSRRIGTLRAFRRQHEDLRSVIGRVLGGGAEGGVLRDIAAAYEGVAAIDVLDTSKEGADAFDAAMKAYDGRVDRVEGAITAKLRDRLGAARNASDMFRVFSKFSALLKRPRVQAAIQEYQAQLIQRVKDDIKALQDKFKTDYGMSEASYMSHVRDIPPVSGAIIWARQIERQLGMYMQRLQDVLGEQWSTHRDGQKLKEEGENFGKKLNAQAIFDAWVAEMDARAFSFEGRIFALAEKAGALSLAVNFDPQVITLFKEVRNLHTMGFHIPYKILLVSNEARELYPFAMSLSETMRTYKQALGSLHDGVKPLVASYRRDLHTLFAEGAQLRWGGDRVGAYARKLADAVTSFANKTHEALAAHEQVAGHVAALRTCPLDRKAMGEHVGRVQRWVDELELGSFSGLEAWARSLDAQIEEILAARLEEALAAWAADFAASRDAKGKENPAAGAWGGRMERVTLEIALRNGQMAVEPPLEHARLAYIASLHSAVGVVCDLPRVQAARFDVLAAARAAPRGKIGHPGATKEKATYVEVLAKLPPGTLFKAYRAIEDLIEQVRAYAGTWLQYQALWELDAAAVHTRLGSDLRLWQALLVQIKKARTAFDSSEAERSFGPVTVDIGQVQAKVTAKYDAWHREVLGTFGRALGDAIRGLHAALAQGRQQLEGYSPAAADVGEAVGFLLQVQDMRRKMKGWTQDLETFVAGQRLLERQRYAFPSDWTQVENAEGEWAALNEILTRKEGAIRAEVPALQAKVASEERALDARVAELLDDWEAKRPVQGDVRPAAALELLAQFEGRLARTREEQGRLARAREALGLPAALADRLAPLGDEIADFRAAYAEVAPVWEQLRALRETPWSAVAPRKVRTTLEEILASLRALPARVRQYAVYETTHEALNGHLKANALVTELKSEALRERHWRALAARLRVAWGPASATLGDLWDADLLGREKAVREVLAVAQGELALEEYLRMIKEHWAAFELDLVAFRDRTRLVRGWEDLLAKVAEHLSGLSSMKMSPYFKVFEEEGAAWEDKLTRLRMLLDTWVDVQRRWVYLEGIFFGSAEIAAQLPAEHQRFKVIDSEFLALMRRVAKQPLLMDAMNIPDIARALSRLADLLAKIQKALGEYLERGRAAFPRFYFVGDEDLLEIIGNAKDPTKVQRHLRKMFAGIGALLLDADGASVRGVVSPQGEEVLFAKPVSIKEDPAISAWLTKMEAELQRTLAGMVGEAVKEILGPLDFASPAFAAWLDRYPCQVAVLGAQVAWVQAVEKALAAGDLPSASARVEANLRALADSVLTDLSGPRRRKVEMLITELVHQRDVVRRLERQKVSSAADFAWLYYTRPYWEAGEADPLRRLTIRVANASFVYGFEYLGVQDRLVQTPLTDRCFYTLTQALHSRMGGSPFGPAGTGKTETVKQLGSNLGRFTLVFNCDERFDFQAMGRILVGLCMTGAWGCFDEFNRLEERILSAVSQQIQAIQMGLRETSREIELAGKSVRVHPQTGVFVTMNPGYAGRSNLPDNLKQLFRSIAMIEPDRELIAQVMLFSKGFRSAEVLASKAIPFFKLCGDQLSAQPHYDFGLRALKAVLNSAGALKRAAAAAGEEAGEAWEAAEQGLLVRSVLETMVPKLVADDIPLLRSLLADVFPGVAVAAGDTGALREAARAVCEERGLVPGDAFVDKMLQLAQIAALHHGLMMVGPSGSGKTAAWRALLEALGRVEGVKGEAHVIDPKALSKEALYGHLDPTTREWTDGVFTHLLRQAVDGARGAARGRRHWIVFDGDVDPEWVENLNSVLDDNRILTLPNGERLGLPPNVRVVFEVKDLKYATLATVSRCGMVWFSEQTVTPDMLLRHHLAALRAFPLEPEDRSAAAASAAAAAVSAEPGAAPAAAVSPTLAIQRRCADVLAPFFDAEGAVLKALAVAEQQEHVMEWTRLAALSSTFALLNKGVRNVLDYMNSHADFGMEADHLKRYMVKRLAFAMLWGLCGSARHGAREAFGKLVTTALPGAELPAGTAASLVDVEVRVEDGEWHPWKRRVPSVELEAHRVPQSDLVIPTVDTVRHEEVLLSWLAERRPLVLCGPPGSGKSMTLQATLRAIPEAEVVTLNFASTTRPELVVKALEQYCDVAKTPEGYVCRPAQPGKWLVLFCDEINLPENDKYGTQRVISFLRQLTEQGGFWRAAPAVSFVRLERVQFVGACNPPTDAGRVPLSTRFLRHAPLLHVDYPAPDALGHIYATLNRATLKLMPSLRANAGPLTEAMVETYARAQERFTVEQQSHYVYSPRELTRWVRAMYEALRPLDALPVEGLVRLFVHEGLRLFQDRLVEVEERAWMDQCLDEVAAKYFPSANLGQALKRPILYSSWLSKFYVPVDRNELRDYMKAKLKVFADEELDVPLVVFNEVLDHVLRIDRVLRQPLGHLLLIGTSGAGKTVLARFVAWINGLSAFQIKVSKRYTAADFDEDLRRVMKRAGCQGERICFIFDESNVLSTAFLERMNALLASGEVPGLFEGDERAGLLSAIKEGLAKEGGVLDADEELFRRFTQQVQRNLHVVFTMNPANPEFTSRHQTSPALFNRCVIDWFGDWSEGALHQVAYEFTKTLELDDASYAAPEGAQLPQLGGTGPAGQREALVACMVAVHGSVADVSAALTRRTGRTHYVTPRHFLDLIRHYVALYREKRAELEEQQLHLNLGLQKLRDTEAQVAELQGQLARREAELEAKNRAANEKLDLIARKQAEAERDKHEAEGVAARVAAQRGAIDERKARVGTDLAEAEPAVREAQSSVMGIKKSALDELRSMGNPPALVKVTLEAVCLILGQDKGDLSWEAIRRRIREESFIASVVDFRTEKLKAGTRAFVEKEYMGKADFTHAAVDRASKVAGPLFKWLSAQLHYADILNRIEPLRNELAALEEQSRETERALQELEARVAEIEGAIRVYKEEYSALIGETQEMKAEMGRVRARVDRSMALIRSLAYETARWEESAAAFAAQMAGLPGEALLGAAFLTYIGYFDEAHRRQLLARWRARAAELGLRARPELALVEYLSTPEQRLEWQACGLPADDLSVENAVLLERHGRFPLVVDPSGHATAFIAAKLRARKLAATSFLDEAFLKHLESSLRFGCPLLVQDVEAYDPVLNPVLNREVHRTGGRALIRLGDQEIDFSPAFALFLSTRDPAARFPPDLSSRVTFVNFTVTPSGLHAQCLAAVLSAERPDVDEKRRDLLRLQGEFRARLRRLEQQLLAAISESKGNLLDDTSLVDTMEALKREAADVSAKMEQTGAVMRDTAAVSELYGPVAAASTRLYFAVERLAEVHFLYQVSLPTFLDAFAAVLAEARGAGPTEPAARIDSLLAALFRAVWRRVGRGMLQADHLPFALRLAQIRLQGTPDEFDDALLDFLAKGAPHGAATAAVDAAGLPEGLRGDERRAALGRLAALPAFRGAAAHAAAPANAAAWSAFLAAPDAETCVPECWEAPAGGPLSAPAAALRRLLVVRALRAERVPAAGWRLVAAVFGEDFAGLPLQPDLAAVVEKEAAPGQPLVLVSTRGHDASGRVEALAAAAGRPVASVAMGSGEGVAAAERAISAGAREGRWVLLKNVHLTAHWLLPLEKRLHRLQAHPNFRLFLTTEVHPALPAPLLRASHVLLYEAPVGMRASLHAALATLPAERTERAPVERARLHLLLAWFHALVQERLRYCPLGWSRPYEFGEGELRGAMEAVDYWVDAAAGGKQHLSPDRVPWRALRTVVLACYAGKVDNGFDERLMAALLARLLVPAAYELAFPLVPPAPGAGPPLAAPEGTGRPAFAAWAGQLPGSNPPTWLGLAAGADGGLLRGLGARALRTLAALHGALDDEELAYVRPGQHARDEHLRALEADARAWLASLPAALPPFAAAAAAAADPLARCLLREHAAGARVLGRVRGDLALVAAVCGHSARATNASRALAAALQRDAVPGEWREAAGERGAAVASAHAWVADLRARLEQLAGLAKAGTAAELAAAARAGVWLGGLFAPEAYITATRQAAAQAEQWPLEALTLSLAVGPARASARAFALRGLGLEGAAWSAPDGLVPTDAPAAPLPPAALVWERAAGHAAAGEVEDALLAVAGGAGEAAAAAGAAVPLPVYLNGQRAQLLFTADLPAAPALGPDLCLLRGACVTAWQAPL